MKKEILERLEKLQQYVKILESYKKYSLEEIKNDYTLRGAIERYLQVAIECAIDIGEMIISFEALRKPETYREVIRILGEKNILPKDFSNKFEDAVKFRNILVHMYTDIDINILYKILQRNLDDFNQFAKYIAKYLQKLQE